MNQTDIDRVRDDLATMRQATGLGLPIGRSDVYLSLAWAVAGVPLAAWAAISPVGQAAFSVLLVVPGAAVLALSAIVAGKCRRERAGSPLRWREHRSQWIAAGILTPLFGVFLVWSIAKGLSPETMTVTALFMAGLGMLIVPMIDRTRLFYLGWAASTMLFAITAPALGHRYLGVGVGGWLIVSGLLAAGIMSWQLRGSATTHAAD